MNKFMQRRKMLSGKKRDLPIKGQVIRMNLFDVERQYRVIKIIGSIAEVVALYDYNSTTFGSTANYFGSNLDNLLNNTFYNSLTSTAKTAIVAKNISQYTYPLSWGIFDENTHSSWAGYTSKRLVDTQTRNVYALEVEDIEEYFGGTGGSESDKTIGRFSESELKNLFNNPANNFYLRSAWSDAGAWAVIPGGDIEQKYNSATLYTRPAFQIDLTKISWES